PMALLLLEADATVTICHSRTPDLEAEVRQADIVVAAVGRPGHVRGEWLKEGAYVLDVGMNRLPDGKLVDDVDLGAAKEREGASTPVTGGVGRMTVAMLFAITLQAASADRALKAS